MAIHSVSRRKNPLFDPSMMRSLTDVEAAWLAGLTEGEGCIRLQVHDIRDWRTRKLSKDRVTMSVVWAMKDEAVIRRAFGLTGGHCASRGDGLMTLTASSRRALWVLKQIAPHMVGDKLGQAHIAIEFQERRTGGRRTAEQHAWEIDAARRISALKNVGVYATRKGPRAIRLEAAVERYAP